MITDKELQEIADKTGKIVGPEICPQCGSDEVRKSLSWDEVAYNCDQCETSWR